ncbi:MAG: DUF3592 domain-containing protein [Verrucomicrobiia bacterium]
MIARLLALGISVYFRGILLVIGLVFCLVGCLAYRKDADFRKHSRTTAAKVVEHEVASSDSGEVYAAVFEFEVAGKTYRSRSDSWTPQKVYAVGDSAEIRYDERAPNAARLNGTSDKSNALFAGVLGLAFVVAAVFARARPVPRAMPHRRPGGQLRGVPTRLLALAAGLIMLSVGIGMLWSSGSFKRHSRVATGKVVEYQSMMRDGEQVYAPVAEYKVGDQMFRIQSPAYSTSPPYAVGASVEVRYDPGAPQNGRFNEAFELWSLPLIVTGFGLVTVVAALFGKASPPKP